MKAVRFEGTISDKEAEILQKRIEKFGFRIEIDLETGVATAKRPEVIRKPEFVDAIVKAGQEAVAYAGYSWRTLWELAYYGNRIRTFGPFPNVEEAPVEFIRGTTASGNTAVYDQKLLLAETLPPTIDWAKTNYREVAGLTVRAIETWETVVEAFPQPERLIAVE